METQAPVRHELALRYKVPLSQGKPIEWKLASLTPNAWGLTVPLSQGKPIEWKHALGVPAFAIPGGSPLAGETN